MSEHNGSVMILEIYKKRWIYTRYEIEGYNECMDYSRPFATFDDYISWR